MNFLVSVGLFMKRRSSIFFLLVAAVFTTLLCGCVKERNCSCIYTDVEGEVAAMLNVDAGISCEHVTTMGYEELGPDGEWQTTSRPVKCIEQSTKK